MKKKLVSILLSLTMIATMTASFTATSFAGTESVQVQAEDHNIMLGVGMGGTDMSALLKMLNMDDMSSLLNMLGVNDLDSLLGMFGVTDVSDLIKVLGGTGTGDLSGLIDADQIGDLLGILGINDLSDLISKFNITDLSDLIDKLGIGDIDDPIDSDNLSEVKVLAKAAIDSVAGTNTDTAIQELVTKGYAAVDAATTKEEVIAASDEYVKKIYTVIVEGTKIKQNKLVANKNGSIKVSFVEPTLEGVAGYEIQRATDKAFTKNLKTYNNKKTVRNNSKQLKKGTRYYYRVRAKVELADGTITYTDWSNTRYVKCKKTRK